MVEIKLAPSGRITDICRQHGVEPDQSVRVYEMSESGEPKGVCIFSENPGEKSGKILFLAVREKGLLLTDGLIRSALSLMFADGVETAVCADGISPLLLKRLGFAESDGVWSAKLSENFFHCCGDS